jgi:hypothetical protein
VKIRILSAAAHDLANGCRFYEKQAPGVGAYFLDSLIVWLRRARWCR